MVASSRGSRLARPLADDFEADPDHPSTSSWPASLSAHSTTRRSSDRWRRTTSPWRSTLATNPVELGRAEIEQLGDPAHRLGAFTPQEQEESHLPEGEVSASAGWLDRTTGPVEHLDQVVGRRGQVVWVGAEGSCTRE